MQVDYQVIINMYASVFALGFPIGLIMLIGEKLVFMFQDFVLGKRVKF